MSLSGHRARPPPPPKPFSSISSTSPPFPRRFSISFAIFRLESLERSPTEAEISRRTWPGWFWVIKDIPPRQYPKPQRPLKPPFKQKFSLATHNQTPVPPPIPQSPSSSHSSPPRPPPPIASTHPHFHPPPLPEPGSVPRLNNLDSSGVLKRVPLKRDSKDVKDEGDKEDGRKSPHLRSPTRTEFEKLSKMAKEKKSKSKFMKVNAINLLRQWTTFRKYGKRGGPKQRDVRLSPDKLYIEYISSRKKRQDTKFPINQIIRIEEGWNSKNFQRFPVVHSLTKASFTIVHTGGTLDLVAQNKADFLLWTKGLHQVWREYQEKSLSTYRSLEKVEIQMPTSAPYVSYVQYWEDTSFFS
ncbi:hypothetical protein AAMO2058_001376000 [Amorphochlora amoebiformis]